MEGGLFFLKNCGCFEITRNQTDQTENGTVTVCGAGKIQDESNLSTGNALNLMVQGKNL